MIDLSMLINTVNVIIYMMRLSLSIRYHTQKNQIVIQYFNFISTTLKLFTMLIAMIIITISPCRNAPFLMRLWGIFIKNSNWGKGRITMQQHDGKRSVRKVIAARSSLWFVEATIRTYKIWRNKEANKNTEIFQWRIPRRHKRHNWNV